MVPRPIKLAWTTLDAGEQLDRVCDRFQPADMLLGGPVGEYARLAATGKLAPFFDGEKAPFWGVARRSLIVLAGGGPEPPTRLAFDDPRTDPHDARLDHGPVEQMRAGVRGYAKLVWAIRARVPQAGLA